MPLDNNIQILLFVIAGLVVLFFFFILPQQKQKKEDEIFFKSLKIGDAVVTIGGIHGVIIDIVENQVLLQGACGNAKLLVERQSLSPEGTTAIYRKKPVKASKGERSKIKKGKKAIPTQPESLKRVER